MTLLSGANHQECNKFRVSLCLLIKILQQGQYKTLPEVKIEGGGTVKTWRTMTRNRVSHTPGRTLSGSDRTDPFKLSCSPNKKSQREGSEWMEPDHSKNAKKTIKKSIKQHPQSCKRTMFWIQNYKNLVILKYFIFSKHVRKSFKIN